MLGKYRLQFMTGFVVLCLLLAIWFFSGSKNRSEKERIQSDADLTYEAMSDAEDSSNLLENQTPEPQATNAKNGFLEAKAAYFYPTSDQIRKIYPGSMGMFGLEFSYRAWDSFYGWASASFLTKEGRSINEHSPTRVTVVPLALGLKWIYSTKYVDPYIGVGALYTYLHMKDHSSHVHPTTSAWDFGFIGKAGCLIRPTSAFFIDIFAEYSYMKFDFSGGEKIVRHDVDFSGISVGAGLGWSF